MNSKPKPTADEIMAQLRAALGHLNLSAQALQTAHVQQQMAEGRIRDILKRMEE